MRTTTRISTSLLLAVHLFGQNAIFMGGNVSVAGTVNYDFTGGTLPAGITFTRSSTATYNNSSNILSTATTNTARFNYISGTPYLLIEPAATNLLLQSNAFNTAPWFKENNPTITAAQFTSPDGTNNGWSATSGPGGYGGPAQTYTAPAGAVTASCWAKQISGGGSAFYNLGGLVFSGGITISGTISRTSFTGTPGAGSMNFAFGEGNGPGITNGLFGCQVEAGSTATSYISTTTTTRTRSADVATFTIPSGVGHLVYTFDDNSTQTVTVSSGSYTIPTNLNRPNIKTIVSTP